MEIAILIIVAIISCGFSFWAGTKMVKPGINDIVKRDQDIALDIVWRQVYKMGTHPSPKIIWVERPDLKCAGNNAFYDPLSKKEARCVNGLFWPFATMVAWPSKAKFSNTALCHELYHAKLWIETKHSDAEHKAKDWRDPHGLVQQAITALKNHGL